MSEKFDAEKRAAELFNGSFTQSVGRQLGAQIAREAHAAGAREKAEEIAAEIERQAVYCNEHRVLPLISAECAAIARRLAAPPSQETREERYKKALLKIIEADVWMTGAARQIARRALEGKP